MTAPKAPTLQSRFGFQDSDLKKPQHDEMMVWLQGQTEAVLWKMAGDSDECRKVKRAEEEFRADIRGIVAEGEGLLKEKDQVERDLASPTQEGKELSVYQLMLPRELTDVMERLDRLKKREAVLLDTYDAALEAFMLAERRINYTSKWESPVMSGKYCIGFIDLRVCATFETPTMECNGERWRVAKAVNQWSVLFEVKTSVPSLGELMRQINMYREYEKSSWFIVVAPLNSEQVSVLNHQRVGVLLCPSGELLLPA